MSIRVVRSWIIGAIFASLCFIVSTFPVAAQTTAFTYQGKLTDAGSPANGLYDFTFKLFATPGGAIQLGSDVLRGDVQATAGIFTVSLDFGQGPFNSPSAYLEILVRPGASTGAYTTLTPRQQLTTSPYSIQTIHASSADDATNLGGIAANQYLTATSGIQNQSAASQGASLNISGSASAGVFDAATFYKLQGVTVLEKRNTTSLIIGDLASQANFSGVQNLMVGYSAGGINQSGSRDTLIGYAASSGTFGSDNTIIGNQARSSSNLTATVNSCTAVGSGAGCGPSSTAIGFSTLATTAVNSTAIGANAQATQDNTVVLGSVSGVNGATATVNVGIGTNTPKSRLNVAGNIFIENNPNNLIMQSPNGSCWKLSITNLGALTASSITCPT